MALCYCDNPARMLAKFLTSLFSGSRRQSISVDEHPVARREKTTLAHQASPLGIHASILYSGIRVGDWKLNDLVARCLAESDTAVTPLKALHRPLSSYFLTRYYLHALKLEGARAECGVFQGTSALLLCRAAQSVDAAHSGAGLHLVDSFEGLSAPGDQDRFSAQGGSLSLPQGTFAAAYEQARAALKPFPGVTFHRGWIPQAFAALPDTRWSFLHIDVDLYEPTYACLEYFYPRLVSGGVIVCDDYGAPLFPGAYRAWNSFCEQAGVPFVVLDTGQSVLLKP
jgi:O-methyltransferase